MNFNFSTGQELLYHPGNVENVDLFLLDWNKTFRKHPPLANPAVTCTCLAINPVCVQVREYS